MYLFQSLKKAGAQFTFSAGWEVPKWYAKEGDEAGYRPSFHRTNWFEPLRREVKNTLENVSIADITAFAKFDVKGEDSGKYLDYMVANKLPAVSFKDF